MRYHGGKWRLAPWIIQHFPTHTVYVEPFGGAGSVLLRKQRSYAEIYNDMDGDVVNLFRVLRDPGKREKLLELVALTPYARSEFEEAFEETEDPVELARRLLIRAEMGFGSAGATKGRTGFRKATTRHKNGSTQGRSVQTIWASMPENLRAVSDRYIGVMIENRPALDVIAENDTEETLFYVDPPYLHSVRSISGTKAYRHEMTAADHTKLLELAVEVKGMMVISGYGSLMYDDALAGWKKINKQVAAAGNSGSVCRNECLWINPAAWKKLNRQPPLFEGVAVYRY